MTYLLLLLDSNDNDIDIELTPEIVESVQESPVELNIETDVVFDSADPSLEPKKVELALDTDSQFIVKITWNNEEQTTASGGLLKRVLNYFRVARKPTFKSSEPVTSEDAKFINETSNHYKWLELHLEDYWKSVTGKTLSESNAGGIISAHGDKAYCYSINLADHGIPRPWAVAIFLTSYYLKDRANGYEMENWIQEQFKANKEYLAPIDFNEDIVAITYIDAIK